MVNVAHEVASMRYKQNRTIRLKLRGDFEERGGDAYACDKDRIN